MMTPLPESFPPGINMLNDYNPAIRLFGRRFYNEQTLVEYLSEFLTIVLSNKRIGRSEDIQTPLPSLNELKSWPDSAELQYSLPIKFNLKLFAFLGASRVDTRHAVHKEHYEKLCKTLQKRIITSETNAQSVVEWLEELLRGYQGAGFNRAWCAQTFFPISKSLLTKETIWNSTTAKKEKLADWQTSINNLNKFYSIAGHNFMARGGEIIYLQICNALSTNQGDIINFIQSMNFSDEETDLKILHKSLQDGLLKLGGLYTRGFDELVEFIEQLDPDTHEKANRDKSMVSCKWCPKESWQEGYLFAIEINRLLKAVLDPIERLELLMIGCVLQVLRSLCAQSVRYTNEKVDTSSGGLLKYAWIFTSPDFSTKQQKIASQRNLQVIQTLIQRVLRNEELIENAKRAEPGKKVEALYKEADTQYGHKLFLSLGKRLGVITPKKGSGARFVMTDKLLRYLVITLVEPGKRCTYNTFLWRLYKHYGIAIEDEALNDAMAWSSLPPNNSHTLSTGSWLAEMLRAGGFLTELSDACSIVHNDFY